MDDKVSQGENLGSASELRLWQKFLLRIMGAQIDLFDAFWTMMASEPNEITQLYVAFGA